MAEYIEKFALLAEIQARIKGIEVSQKAGLIKKHDADKKIFLFKSVLSLIDTLEVKEVDLDILGNLASHLIACDAHGITPKYRDRELDILEGLANNKAQKGE